jgi:hypothetical protein
LAKKGNVFSSQVPNDASVPVIIAIPISTRIDPAAICSGRPRRRYEHMRARKNPVKVAARTNGTASPRE